MARRGLVETKGMSGAAIAAAIAPLMRQEFEQKQIEAGHKQIPWYDTLPKDEKEVLDRCADWPRGFYEFLRHWRFVNRETGEILTFETLWPGQESAAEQMVAHPWLFLLKAGKLGFSELECAWDGYVARFRQPRASVNLFSKDGPASRVMLEIVKYGLTHLPGWMGVDLLPELAGGDTLTSAKFHVRGTDDDDVRKITSYAASEHVSIESTATHAHVDEISHMKFAQVIWGAVSTTVSPQGTLHLVSRGAGDDKYSAELWKQAMVGRDSETYALPEGRRPESRLVPFFAPYHTRPDHDREWYETERGTRSLQALLHYAPETPEDALAGDETAIYIPVAVWDNCFDPDLPPLVPGDRQACVLSLDAAVSGDNFGAVVVSRHPAHPDADGRACKRTKAQPAIRAARVWAPDPVTGVIDYGPIEAWIRMVCMGGCMEGHPNKTQTILSKAPNGEECPACAEGRRQPGMNVVQICYDEFQLHDMATRLTHDGIAWVEKFPQTTERLVADGQMHKLAMKAELAHNGDPDLREHVGNAKAKLQADEESRMRIVKRAPDKKVDLAVAASMGVKRALDLNIE